MKLLWLCLLWVFVLSACGAPSDNQFPVESNFPLEQIRIFSTEENIERVATSNNWLAIYTSGALTAVDIQTKKPLWHMNVTIQAEDPLGLLMVNDILVATSTNQVFLIDKLGEKKELSLESPEENIIRLAAAYAGYAYINRSPDWRLEAYSTSKNAKLWTLLVGRGETNVFYDESKKISYITTQYESIFAINNATGEVLWKYSGSTLSTAYEDGVIYAVGMGSNSHSIRLSAFDVQKQREIWADEVTFSKYVYTMTVLNDLIVVSGDEGLLAVNKADGAMLWQTPEGESFMSKAVEYDSMIYAKATSHTVYAISPQNGGFVGYVSLESSKSVEPGYDLVSGVYRVKGGIVFNTRHAVWMYKDR